MRRFGISQHGGAAFTALLGICAASLAWAHGGTAHVATIALPGGGVAQIDYVGNEVSRVVMAPVAFVQANPFAVMDRLAAEMDAQAAGMMRQAALMNAQPMMAPIMVDAGDMLQGAVSASYVATFDGGAFCARSTQVTSAGPGMRPQVVSQVSGSCGSEAPGVASVAVPHMYAPGSAKGTRTIRVRDDGVPRNAIRPAVIYTPAD